MRAPPVDTGDVFIVREGNGLSIQQDVLKLLDEVLCLEGRAMRFRSDTPLLGNLPELDSMAVLAVIQELESRFGVEVPDDEIAGDTFETVGTVVDFVQERLVPA